MPGWFIRSAVVAAAGALSACSPRVDLSPEDLACNDTRLDTRGCAFAVVSPLHLVPALSAERGLSQDRWEQDGIIVVNDGMADARVQLVEPATDSEPARAVQDAKTLSPGESSTFRLPRRTSEPVTGFSSLPAFVVQADAPVSTVLFAPYRSFVGNDSGLLIPKNAWGSDYVVSTYPPHGVQFQGLGEPTYFDVVTLDGGVTVRWRPRSSWTAAGDEVFEVGPNAWSREVELEPGIPLRVVAKRDELDPHAADLSGTLIEASGPILVQAGSRCSAVPIESEPVSGCDPLFETMPPISAWRRTYALAHPPLRTDEQHHYRVFAGADRIEVVVAHDGATQTYALADKGAFVDLVLDHGTNAVVSADGPVLPVGYLQTRDAGAQVGDPAMYTVVAPEQFLLTQTVSTGVQWSSHWIQVVREVSEQPLILDGEEVAGWSAFGGFEVVSLEILEGVHTLESDQPFGLTQFGWTNERHDACVPFASAGTCQTSYAHPGAHAFGAD